MPKSSSWSEEFSQFGLGIEPKTLAIAPTPSKKFGNFTALYYIPCGWCDVVISQLSSSFIMLIGR